MAKKSPGDVKMGGASVQIGGDDSLFNRVVTAAQKRLMAFASAAAGIAGKVGGALSSIGLVGNGIDRVASLIATPLDIAKQFMEVASTAGSMASKIGLTKDDVKAAMQMKGAYLELWRAITNVRNAIGAALAPVFTKLFRLIIPMIDSFAAWIRANKQLIPQMVGIAAAIAAIPIGVMVGLYNVIAKIVSLLSGTSFGNALKAMGDVAEGIGNAILGGDIKLAIDIMWSAFELAGLTAIKSIMQGVESMLNAIVQGIEDILNRLTNVKVFGQNIFSGVKLPKFNLTTFGITDALLAQKNSQLQALLAQAKALPQNLQNQKGAGIPQTLANASVGANAIFSQGAASSIARAYNTQQSIPLKTLLAVQKSNTLLAKLVGKPQVKVKKVAGP